MNIRDLVKRVNRGIETARERRVLYEGKDIEVANIDGQISAYMHVLAMIKEPTREKPVNPWL